MAPTLRNYLKTYRKRAGFSQAELAYLLGYQDSAIISRLERSQRRPGPETMLGYEVALGVPPRELFAGTYEKVEDRTVERACELAEQFDVTDEDRKLARKLATLEQITGERAEASAPAHTAS